MKEDVKFTPGPWELEPDHEAISDGCEPEIERCIFSENVLLAKTSRDATENDKQHLANARLIAAAPDMLREMESLAQALEDTGHEPPESFYLAIAKAYGRTA